MNKILALLFLITTGLYAQSNHPVSLVVTGQLSWVVTTNWSQGGASSTLLYWNGEGKNPNVTTFHENGTTISNLYFVFEINKQPHGVLIQSVPFGNTLYRNYVYDTQKIYSK